MQNLTQGIKLISLLSKFLITRAQTYVDIIMKYMFLSARSLDIYALVNESTKISYDYSYIHPDNEENVYDQLDRGEATNVLNLIRSYQTSWAGLPDIIFLWNTYLSYRNSGNLVKDLYLLKITNILEISQFIEKGSISFEITSDPSFRFELKILAIYIFFKGAETTEPVIKCNLEHRGNWKTKKRDGTIHETIAPLRSMPILATNDFKQFQTSILQTTPPDPRNISFWGRGIMTKWHLYIDPDTIQKKLVNFSNLSEIQIAIKYEAFSINNIQMTVFEKFLLLNKLTNNLDKAKEKEKVLKEIKESGQTIDPSLFSVLTSTS